MSEECQMCRDRREDAVRAAKLALKADLRVQLLREMKAGPELFAICRDALNGVDIGERKVDGATMSCIPSYRLDNMRAILGRPAAT